MVLGILGNLQMTWKHYQQQKIVAYESSSPIFYTYSLYPWVELGYPGIVHLKLRVQHVPSRGKLGHGHVRRGEAPSTNWCFSMWKKTKCTCMSTIHPPANCLANLGYSAKFRFILSSFWGVLQPPHILWLDRNIYGPSVSLNWSYCAIKIQRMDLQPDGNGYGYFPYSITSLWDDQESINRFMCGTVLHDGLNST